MSYQIKHIKELIQDDEIQIERKLKDVRELRESIATHKRLLEETESDLLWFSK